jgi:hypothetical protein
VPEVFPSPSTRNRKEGHDQSETNEEAEEPTRDQHCTDRTNDKDQQAKEYDDDERQTKASSQNAEDKTLRHERTRCPSLMPDAKEVSS